MTSLLAWHGCRADGTTRHLKIKERVGVKTLLAGDVELCRNALHGSMRAVDMLRFSEGLWVKRTLHEGKILHDTDKIGSSERTVVAETDATQVVVDWAFWCADRAVRVHAVTALRRAGMDIEAERLAGLEAITDKKSALAAYYGAANALYAVDNAGNTNITAHAAIYAASNAAVAAAAVYAAAVYAVYTAAAAANETDEMNFLNAELERRLLALMGLIETEVTQ